MKKNTRITESDIRRIVRKIIQEQITPKFDYLFSREDGETSATKGQKLFFVQNGDTFDVWAEEYTRDGSKGRMINTGKKLPKISELGIIYDESNERFGNSDGSIIASDIAKIITPQMERSRGNWIIYVDNEGIPTKGKLSIRSLPKDFFGKKGGKGFKLKNGAVIFGNDYFISENDRGIGISIQEPIKAGKA